jgi:diguanylate cyclase (GGDEF)-like protein/PAS domain S-box-containing protein
MRGPLVDIVLLALVVAFFALEQRRRPEVYFRFWLAGWVLVLLSYGIWEFSPVGATALVVQECLRETTICLGAIAFLFSFLAGDREWRTPLRHAAMAALPMCLGLDLLVAHAAPMWVSIAIAGVGEAIGGILVYRYLGRRGEWLFPLLAGLCPLFGAGIVVLLLTGHAEDVVNVALAQVFLSTGMLFARIRVKGGRALGAVGFLLWAIFYVLDMGVMPQGLREAALSVWVVPKYLVGFGMILKIFAEAQSEIARLGMRHRRLYEEYRLLFNSNPHPMWIHDVATERFLSVNKAAIAAYGFSEEAFLRMKVSDLLGSEDGDGALAIPDVTENGMRGDRRVSRHQRADGSVFDVDMMGHDISFEGRDARFVLAVDITEREDLNRELIRRAHHDALTGLPNRVMLDDRMAQWLLRCMREESMGALLTVDIDHFKKVNDTYGHMAGDECLKQTAQRLKSRVRQVDTIARTGGEEFTIVIGGLKSREGAAKVCSELLKLFTEPIVIGGHAMAITISIGVALYPLDGVEMDVLRKRSDQALYRAKREGRGRAVFASEDMVIVAPVAPRVEDGVRRLDAPGVV